VSAAQPSRIVVAPDSFKSTLSAVGAADAIAYGLRSVRPELLIECLPQADGGEGTLDAVLAASSGVVVHTVQVDLPSGRRTARWLMLADGTAVVELAECCGLPLWGTSDPLGATTAPLGIALRSACELGAERVVIGLGGSAATDGGAGCVRELGLVALGHDGLPVPEGGVGLLEMDRVDDSAVLAAPRGGVLVLCDVVAPLFGGEGAAAVFGPQKGANAAQVETLDAGLRHWAALLGGDPSVPGSGAAGGTAFGLAGIWSVALVSGAQFIAELTGLDRSVPGAAMVITGEGCHDSQSYGGKSTGHVIELAQRDGVPVAVVAGAVDISAPGVRMVSLTELAGSTELALASPTSYLRLAGELLASLVP
jgi:glycerate kinase